MYVLRRTVNTAITISPNDQKIVVRLVGIDWLGACALLNVSYNGKEPELLEMGPGERVELHPYVHLHLLRLAYATNMGTPARVAEFGIDAPRSILVQRSEVAS